MAINIDRLKQHINENWPKWNANQRRQAERDYNEALRINAEEKANSQRKDAQRDQYTQQALGTLGGVGGSYLGYLGATGQLFGTTAAGTTVGSTVAGTTTAAAAPTVAGAAGTTAAGTGAGAAAAGGSTMGAVGAAAPYVAAAVTAYLVASQAKKLNDKGIKPFSGDYTTREVDSIADPNTLYGLRKYNPKELTSANNTFNKYFNPGYQVTDAIFGSTKHDDQVIRDRVRKMLEKEGFAEKQGKTHFIQLADGSYADIGHEDQTDAQGNKIKNYNLDLNDQLTKEALSLVNPIAHMFGGGDQKVSSDTAGILTNAFKSNAKNVDDVRANILSFLSKKGITTEDIRTQLGALKEKGKISDEYFNVFSADLNKITDGLITSPVQPEQQVGAAPVQAAPPVEAPKATPAPTDQNQKPVFDRLAQPANDQNSFLKSNNLGPSQPSNPFMTNSNTGLMGLSSPQSGVTQPSNQPFSGSLVGRGGVLTPNQPLVQPQPGFQIDPYRNPADQGLIGLGSQPQTVPLVRR